MQVIRQQEWKGGWFVGDFEPTAYPSKGFEVCYKKHAKGEVWPKHYHKEATEINYMIRGKMTIINQTLTAGDVFVIERHEVADPIFHEDCELIVIKVPSVKNDKYEV